MSEDKPKKRARQPNAMAKNAPPPVPVSVEEARKISRNTLRELLIEYNQPKVMSDNQLRDRLNGYLNRCYKSGQYPTVEEGLLATGYSKAYMLDIAHGRFRGKYFTPEAAEIIQKFLDIVAAFDAKMVLEGKLPQIPYIFRAKNYSGMVDKAEGQINANTQVEQDIPIEDIAKRYAIETTFAEGAERQNGQNGQNAGGQESQPS